jgi:hypothetical protein
MPLELPVDSTSPVPQVALLGNDAALAARPATPVQLAHACLRAGFQAAIPASWGDELVAAECVRQLERRGRAPAIQCACPHVVGRLLAAGAELASFLIPVVPPPVAAARYLRHLYGADPVRITYIGNCPGAADEAIDAHLPPADFLEALKRRGLPPDRQPRVFDSVIPPDRRRHASLPGGLPTPELLWTVQRRVLVELDEQEYLPELAQHLVAAECVLLDLAPRLGCACSGVTGGVPAATARQSVLSLEPPRAPQPPIDTSVYLALARPLPAAAPSSAGERGGLDEADDTDEAEDRAARGTLSHDPVEGHGAARQNGNRRPGGAEVAPRSVPGQPHSGRPAGTGRSRRPLTPAGYFRASATQVPQTRSGEGRVLPRAYVARRHSPIVLRAVSGAAPVSSLPATPTGAASDAPATITAPDLVRAEGPPVGEPERLPTQGPPPAGPVAPPAALDTRASPVPDVAAATDPPRDDRANAEPDRVELVEMEVVAVELVPPAPAAEPAVKPAAAERPLTAAGGAATPTEPAAPAEPAVPEGPEAPGIAGPAPDVAPASASADDRDFALRLAALLLVAVVIGVLLAMLLER